MTIPSSQSLIFEVKSKRKLRLRQTSDVFGRLRTSSGIFGNDRVVFKNPSTPRIKISRLYLRKSWQVYEGRETGRFDTRTQAVKLHKNFDHFKKSLQLNRKNILGEYSSFFKPSTWNYLHLDGINLYRNDFASKGPVTERSQRHLKTEPLSLCYDFGAILITIF